MNGVPVPVELDDAALAAIAAAVAPDAGNSAPESPYLSAEEAAAYLRCSRQRVYDLLSARRLTRIKDGSRTLLARSEVEEYLNGRRTK